MSLPNQLDYPDPWPHFSVCASICMCGPQITTLKLTLFHYPVIFNAVIGHTFGMGPIDYVQTPPSGIILFMRPANERRRYIVTSLLIGWVHTQNDSCPLGAGILQYQTQL